MDKLVPDIYQKSIYTIDYKKLKKNGIKCLMFDLDNTIAPLTVSVPDKKMKDQIEHVKDMGFRVIILSNGPKFRVNPFKDGLNLDSSHSSMKPMKKKYIKIMKMYNLEDTEVACIGDQLLTDVLGANRMGLTSILVNPVSTDDIPITKINRFLENFIYNKLEKKGLLTKGNYYD